MRLTVRLEARTDAGEVETTELATITRPAAASTLADIGLMLAEAKALLARLQASMVRSQVEEYVAARRACMECGELRPLKDRRTRRLQTLFGTGEVEAPRFRTCRCVLLARPSKGSCPNAWCRSAGSGSPGRGWAGCQTAAGDRLTGGVSLNGASVSRLM